MNRLDEYQTLMQELELTPTQLDDTVVRARKKLSHTRLKQRVFYPLCTLTAIFTAFVLSVNLFPSFAKACSEIGILKDLIKAVAFSPSLKNAVEHEYVQRIDQTQTENDITVTLKYMIVDTSELHIFYTVNSELYQRLGITPETYVIGFDGMGCGSIYNNFSDVKNDELLETVIGFDGFVFPENLVFSCQVYAYDHLVTEPTAIFDFLLTFDQSLISQGDCIELNQSFMLENQKFTAVDLVIFPTRTIFHVKSEPTNTALLQSLQLYLMDEHGEQYYPVSNGVISSGSTKTHEMDTYMLDSSYYSDYQHLSLYIEGASWLDKEMAATTINLKKQTASYLPEGVTIESFEKKENNWVLKFNSIRQEQFFASDYYDPNGSEYYINEWSYTPKFSDSNHKEAEYTEVSFELPDYPYDSVSIRLPYTRKETYEEPIVIPIQ